MVRTSFHQIKHGAALGRDAPPAICPVDQPLRKDVQPRHPPGEPPGALGPVATAGRQNGHIPLEILQGSEPIRVAHQDLEDRHVEIHPRPHMTIVTSSGLLREHCGPLV